ncbi:MAG: PDZ domain-containing protein [Candidatus Solibacter sp.]
MRTSLGIALVAVNLAASPIFAQTVVIPRERGAQNIVVEKSGGYLGIGGLDISPERAKALNLKEERGVEVSSLAPDGPAAKAGMKAGDVVLEFAGQPVQGTAQFQRLVRETPAGRQVKITVWRNSALQTLNTTVGENQGRTTIITPNGSSDGNWNFHVPEIPNMPEIPRFQMSSQNPMLGIVGEALGQEDQLAEFFGVQDGVLVRSVRKGSAAEKAGIKAGDVITKVDDSKVGSSSEITRALRNVKSKKTFNVTVVRNKHEMSMPVAMETAGSTGSIRAALLEVDC